MSATGFVDACGFIPTAGGTGNFVASAAIQGYQLPATAGATNGTVYSYRAESSDKSQWEEGFGADSVAGSVHTITRSTITANSSGGTTAINFTVAPNVFITALSADFTFINAMASVTGAAETYATAQARFNIQRSNSGSPMIDTLPGTGAFLPANSVLAITNADASALLAISAASGATIKGGPTYNGFLYIGPGQCAKFQSDGAGNYWVLSVPTRAKLGANTTIFVEASGGSDTASHGLTTGSQYATPNNIWLFAQNAFDLNGFILTIQLANGNYAVNSTFSGQMVGQNGPGSVIIQGNVSSPSSVTVPGTGSGETISVVSGAQCQIQGIDISSTSGQGVFVSSLAVLNFQNNICGACTGAFLAASLRGVVRIIGSYTINGNQGDHWNANGGTIGIEAAGVTITLTGTPAFAVVFAFALNLGLIFFDNIPTFSGSATGQRWGASNNGVLSTGGSTLPGSTGGIANTGGQFN